MTDWQPIETAPRDGTVIDLWIEGPDSDVDFYSLSAKKVRGKPIRHGRVCNMRWEHRPPNNPSWYSMGGLGYSLFPTITATHWMPIPDKPK